MSSVRSTKERLKNRKSTRKEFRSPDEIAWRAAVGESIRAFAPQQLDPEKWIKRAEQFENCSLNPKTKFKAGIHDLPDAVEAVWACPDDNRHDAVVFCETCDSRGCPDCANRQTARLASRYVPVAKDLMSTRRVGERLRHIILTTPVSLNDPDCPEKFEEYFKLAHDVLNMVQRSFIRKNSKQYKALEKTLGRAVRTSGYDWKKRGGAIIASEFGEHGRKLHFHIIHYGEFITQRELATWWRYLSNQESEIVWLRGVTTKAEDVESQIMETVKYSTKFWKSHVDADGNRVVSFIEPELMPKMMKVLDGTRRVRTYGVFYNIPEPEKECLKCEQCEAELVRIGRSMWSFYVEYGYDRVTWEKALNSKLANKSRNSSAGQGDKPPPKQLRLPLKDDLSGYRQ